MHGKGRRNTKKPNFQKKNEQKFRENIEFLKVNKKFDSSIVWMRKISVGAIKLFANEKVENQKSLESIEHLKVTLGTRLANFGKKKID